MPSLITRLVTHHLNLRHQSSSRSISFATLAFLLLSACSPDPESTPSSSHNSQNDTENSPAAANDTQPAPEPRRTHVYITGTASKGPIAAATITLHQTDGAGNLNTAALASSSTDNRGDFNLTLNNLNNLPAALILRSQGGHYIDEADEADTPRQITWAANQGLRGATFFDQSSNPEVNGVITVLTEALIQKSQRESRGGNFVATLQANQLQSIQALGFDPFSVLPAHPTQRPSPSDLTDNTTSRNYGQIIGGIANSINRAAIQLGFAEPNYATVIAIARDLSDGQLDGQIIAVDGNIETITLINAAGNNQALPNNIDLNREIRRFYNNNLAVYQDLPVATVDTTQLGTAVALENRPPTANNDVYLATRQQPLVLPAPGILSNDTDPENHPITAILVNGPAHGNLTLNPDGSFEYTHTGVQQNTDQFTYRVTDSSLISDTATVTLNIANEAPIIANQSITVIENTPLNTVVGQLNAADPDGDNITFNALNNNTPFSISNSGQIRVRQVVNFEAENAHNLNIQVTDTAGNSNGATLIITISNIDELPQIALQNFSLPENTPINGNVDQIKANDPENTALIFTALDSNTAPFTINSNGSIQLDQALDFETVAEYVFNIQVADAANNTATAALTITITDVNEAPSIEPQTLSIAENTPADTAIGQIQATDPENNDLTYTAFGGSGTSVFTVSATGQVTLSQAVDFETTISYNLNIRITDSANNSSTNTLTINVTNIDEPPQIAPQNFSVPENTTVNSTIGQITAVDPEGTALSFTIQGNNSTPFTINTDGSIQLNEALDFETTTEYTLDAQVADSANNTAAATLTFTITDINEAPSIDPQEITVPENQATNSVLGQVTATDPENDALTYSELANNNAPISVTTNGVVTLTQPLDFETTSSYVINIQVSDTAGNSTNSILTLTVANINEPPVAQDDNVGASYQSSINIDVTDNDSDPENDTLLVSVPDQSNENGELSLNGNDVNYVAPDRFVGIDSFTYTVCSAPLADNLCTTGNATITVTAANSMAARTVTTQIDGDSFFAGDHVLVGSGEAMGMRIELITNQIDFLHLDLVGDGDNTAVLETNLAMPNNWPTTLSSVSSDFYGQKYLVDNMLLLRSNTPSNNPVNTPEFINCTGCDNSDTFMHNLSATGDRTLILENGNNSALPVTEEEFALFAHEYHSLHTLHFANAPNVLDSSIQTVDPVALRYIESSANNRIAVYELLHSSTGISTVKYIQSSDNSVKFPPRPHAPDNTDYSTYQPQISDDGQYVLFRSDALGFVPLSEYNGSAPQWYIWEPSSDTIQLVSADERGNPQLGTLPNQAPNAQYGNRIDAALSGDGRYVIFEAQNGQLTGHNNTKALLYIKALDTITNGAINTGEIAVLALGHDGLPINDVIDYAQISFAGQVISFESNATNIDAADTNADADVFVLDNPLFQNSDAEDYDDDNVTNLVERQLGSLPNIADSDLDGLDDGNEVSLGSSPTLADTDMDGLHDGYEQHYGGQLLLADAVITVDNTNGNDNNTAPYNWSNSLRTSPAIETAFASITATTNDRVFILFAGGTYFDFSLDATNPIVMIGGIDPSTALNTQHPYGAPQTQYLTPHPGHYIAPAPATIVSGALRTAPVLRVSNATQLDINQLAVIDGYSVNSSGLLLENIATVNINNSRIHRNIHPLGQGGGAIIHDSSTIIIENTTFTENSSPSGSALKTNSDNILINHSYIGANITNSTTLAFDNNNSSINLTNNMISHNFAYHAISGFTLNSLGDNLLFNNVIWGNFNDTFNAEEGPVVQLQPSGFHATTILANTFAHNAPETAQPAVFWQSPTSNNQPDILVADNIFWFNQDNARQSVAQIGFDNNLPLPNYITFDANASQDYPSATYGTNPISITPDFDENFSTANLTGQDVNRTIGDVLTAVNQASVTAGANSQRILQYYAEPTPLASSLGYRDFPKPLGNYISTMDVSRDIGSTDIIRMHVKPINTNARPMGNHLYITAWSFETPLYTMVHASNNSSTDRPVLQNIGQGKYEFILRTSDLPNDGRIRVEYTIRDSNGNNQTLSEFITIENR